MNSAVNLNFLVKCCDYAGIVLATLSLCMNSTGILNTFLAKC